MTTQRFNVAAVLVMWGFRYGALGVCSYWRGALDGKPLIIPAENAERLANELLMRN